jgi:TonB family protein
MTRVGPGERGRRWEILAGLALSLAVHAAVFAFGPSGVSQRLHDALGKPQRKPVPVEVRREKARLLAQEEKKADLLVAELLQAEKEAPKPPEPKKAEKPKEPKKKKPAPPVGAGLDPARKTKPDQPPAPNPQPGPPGPGVKPAPFVLSHVSLSGGVQVQTGDESNLLGDPSVDATGWKKPDPNANPGDGAGGGGAAERKVVIKPPEAVSGDSKGRYPEEHRDLRRVVRVELLLSIDAQGAVKAAKVTKGDLPGFNREAEATGLRLRFRPATRDGVPMPYRLAWTVVFIPENE